MKTIRTAAHTAVIDPMTGEGLLVLPRPETDVLDPDGLASLNTGDGLAMLAALDSMGFELTEDDDGGPMVEGFTPAGRLMVGLYGREPISRSPALDDRARASHEVGMLVTEL